MKLTNTSRKAVRLAFLGRNPQRRFLVVIAGRVISVVIAGHAHISANKHECIIDMYLIIDTYL